MTVGIDVVLQEIEGGFYDIQIGDDGDLVTSDSFDTAILMSLLMDQRATASEVAASQLRRGWIGNEATPGIEMGSKIWLYSQARNTRSTASGIASEAQAALQWMVDNDHAVSVSATAEPTVDGVALSVTLERPSGLVERRLVELWDNTGVS